MKELEAVKDTQFPMLYRLKFKGGGRLPVSLSGLYSLKRANTEIQNYTDGYDRPKIYPKAPKNDKPTRRAKQNGEEKDIS